MALQLRTSTCLWWFEVDIEVEGNHFPMALQLRISQDGLSKPWHHFPMALQLRISQDGLGDGALQLRISRSPLCIEIEVSLGLSRGP